MLFAEDATFSAVVGGCLVECGAGSGMAAAGLVQMMGGNVTQCMDAASVALQNITGLACDPVAGLVEVPCVYRNIVGVANAVCAANLALSGVGLIMPADEVIDAMRRVGRQLPASLRETGEGGCAACESICKRLHHKE